MKMMNNYVVTLLITHDSLPWIMISFNAFVIIWRREVLLKLNVQGQGGGRISDIDKQGDEGLETWTIFMDIVWLSSLMKIS